MKPTLLIGIAGVALTVIVGYNGIYVPQRGQVSQIQAQLAEEQATQRMRVEVASLLESIEQHRKQLPQEPDPSWFVREVVALTKHADVQVATITQDSPQAVGPFTRLGVTLQCAASYHQLGTFLDDVERSDHFLQVERVNVTRVEDGKPAAIQLVLSTMYLPHVLKPSK